MLTRYQKAVHLFESFCNILEGGLCSAENEVDAQLCRFLDAAWNEGEPRSLAADAICGVQHALCRRRIFPGAWRLLRAWDKAELPNRTPPLPPLCALGLSGFLVSEGQLGAAALVAVGFHCFLRTGELLNMRWAHVTWASSNSGVIWLPVTKSGVRTGTTECVVFSDSVAAGLLRWAAMGRDPQAKIWEGTPQGFRDLWGRACRAIGIDPGLYKPYALRRGGASFFISERRSIVDCMAMGRWGSIKACKIYAVGGMQLLKSQQLPPTCAELCCVYAQLLHGASGLGAGLRASRLALPWAQ